MIHLITYGNDKFNKSKIELCKEARDTNWFHTITSYGFNNISTKFKNDFKNILSEKKRSWLLYMEI